MKINTSNVFYSNDNRTNASLTSQQTKKKVLLTEYSEVSTAVNKGTLTVDGVTLELSDEVRAAIKKANDQQFKDNEAVCIKNALIHNANVAKQQGDAMQDAIDKEVKAMEIARRIARGGHVPLQDEQLLMEYSSEMYQMAKQAAMMAKEHEKYDSLIDKESEEPQNYDVDEGKIDTRYQVEVEVSLGETPVVESVLEVAVSSGGYF